MEQEWAAEKETLLAQVEGTKEECSQLQAKIREAKEAASTQWRNLR